MFILPCKCKNSTVNIDDEDVNAMFFDMVFFVRCGHCGKRGQKYDSKHEAVDGWNILRSEEMKQERDKLMRLLESFTPGGSEYHNSPDNCARWIRERFGCEGALIKALAQKNIKIRQLEADINEMMY